MFFPSTPFSWPLSVYSPFPSTQNTSTPIGSSEDSMKLSLSFCKKFHNHCFRNHANKKVILHDMLIRGEFDKPQIENDKPRESGRPNAQGWSRNWIKAWWKGYLKISEKHTCGVWRINVSVLYPDMIMANDEKGGKARKRLWYMGATQREISKFSDLQVYSKISLALALLAIFFTLHWNLHTFHFQSQVDYS